MEFNNAESTMIRTVLGYQNTYRFKNSRLESALSQADADGAAIVRAELAGIAEVDKELRAGGVGYSSAGTASVDKSLRFATARGENPSDKLKGLGRMHITRLSNFFGVPIMSDYYGTGGYAGDPWANGIGQTDGTLAGSFDIKLG
jgi:hypothetical protein